MKKIEHLGIAVDNLEKAKKLFDTLFLKEGYKTEEVESEGVITHFYQLGESKIELLEGTNESSPISKYIVKKGGGMHHIAFDVENVQNEIDRLKEAGFVLLNDQPKKGADNKLIAFIHPKSTGGILVELCQDAD